MTPTFNTDADVGDEYDLRRTLEMEFPTIFGYPNLFFAQKIASRFKGASRHF
ncbi:MAG: hypothetical protein Q8K46_00365 [Deltaproteobacteria bacterium]|nr:hypothetical protein [Deltaproteobacteria bacterium]